MERVRQILWLMLPVFALIFLISVPMSCASALGIGSFGPTITRDATVQSKHVDVSGAGDSLASHYMVTTDKGTFEVENGLLLGVWNADELYGGLVPGQQARITTKGEKVVGWLFQEYPCVVKVEPAGK